ncbi:hypothetical protein UFOVP1516_38 [uncultured Caudovirales phage]|uniref:Uncharacterized protein n=1 Tax=uncultured Caudovirales phage TaxID=2100421 RepID=A0A6J7XAN5_9CAUD|nr:hypothetical protein UFOVP887_6 [uncultured Caudovirales phage]CAB5226836.1 hypothetical protein UFOVP1516_38 [uncultured Caudovirales phage]
MFEKYSALKYTRIGVIEKDCAWDEYIVVEDPDYSGILADAGDLELNEYFGEMFTYTSGQQFCDYINVFKEDFADDRIIVLVHHQLDV